MNGTPDTPELSIASNWSSSFANARFWSPAQRKVARCAPMPPPRAWMRNLLPSIAASRASRSRWSFAVKKVG